ncbi:hypothetical protein CDD80_2881 [Ophiocordyceps camponoti-rufipedis]|uniref:ATP-grasp domain-containing protein n=1 Tax=Ophiocordyceps camponoti-rufipedis TaxID=2004952 RepID=A0A2C5Z6B2_9HYPO|nr:hypothetical protein CDD80_2881 [Ophiocordyceps camponoti-rufipedis]
MAPPLIEFDATLKDLYQLGSTDLYASFVVPVDFVQLSRGLPISQKYIYQNPQSSSESVVSMRIMNQIITQFLTMIAGAINVVFFDLDMPGQTKGPDLQARADTEAVLGQIARHQRPSPKHVQDSSEIVLPPGAVIANFAPIDCLEHLPSLISFDAHYRALSKRDLALSGVPTPQTDVIDTMLDARQVQDPQLRAAEVRRMLELVKQKPLPYVVKLPQACAGRGTYIVRNQDDRSKTVEELGVVVDRMLGQLCDANSHLRPVCLILQELVAGSALAISMFISKAGEAVLTSCCDQKIGPHGRYDGGHIDYSQQPRLKTEYTPIAKQVTAYMHRLGYHGPASFDAMTGPDGQHLVIDMNARVAGSFALGLLKGFFHTARGFNNVSLITAGHLVIGLGEFRSRFSAEIDEGRLVIGGWCRETKTERSAAEPADFSFLLRPEVYHPLTTLHVPPPFLNSNKQSDPDASLDELLQRGQFRAAAIAAVRELTGSGVDPRDGRRILNLFYTRLACLTLIDATPLAAQEAKAVEDLRLYVEGDGGHLAPWPLRLLHVRLQALGFGDARRAVMSYHDLAREARLHIARARDDADARALWTARLDDLAIHVAGALVDMDDLAGAVHHLDSLPDAGGGGSRLALCRALLWLQVGDADRARQCATRCAHDADEVVRALCDMAEADYESALARWQAMDDDDEIVAVNKAVCFLYLGRMDEGRDAMEGLVTTTGAASHALLFNLSTMYELCTDGHRGLKLKLAERVAGLDESPAGWERVNADFKL